MQYKLKTTPEKSKQMSRVHTKNGKDEVILRKLLWKYGVRYRTNYKGLIGKPDIAITKYKIAVFIDGEFWHGHHWAKHKARLKRNREFWINKIEGNMRHDQKVNEQLKKDGWTVLRFWSKKVLKDPEYYAQIVMWHIRGKVDNENNKED